MKAGDSFDYRTNGLDCGWRFKVTSVAPATSPSSFGIERVRRYGGWCDGFVDDPGAAKDAEFVWRVQPGLPGPDGIRVLLRDEPAGEGTYRLYTESPFVLDVPAGMQVIQDGILHLSYYTRPPPNAPQAAVRLIDVDTGSVLGIDAETGRGFYRDTTSDEVDALFDQIVDSIRRVEVE